MIIIIQSNVEIHYILWQNGNNFRLDDQSEKSQLGHKNQNSGLTQTLTSDSNSKANPILRKCRLTADS